MILTALIGVPLAGGLLAWLIGRKVTVAGRWIALAAAGTNLVLVLALWVLSRGGVPGDTGWIVEQMAPWIPALGVSWHLAVDGLSLLMVGLSSIIGLLCVVISWKEITHRVGLFHGILLWTLAGINGVFLSLDLFLFYCFWEVMLVPMYFLIGIWGHERRIYAAVKFFIFTQVGGLLMLVAILGLVMAHGSATGEYTFDYTRLLGTDFAPGTAMWLMLGFFAAFAVKLPVVPFHSWLPDAHGEAPTAGSVILAALLLKTGAYGLIRFTVPLFPEAAASFAPVATALAAVGIVYGAVLAFSQTNLKRLVAYTSVSHMGFVLLGVFAWNQLALQGVVLQMICHGISTGALFMIAGMLLERLHTREIGQMGGFWAQAPRMGGVAMVFVLASLGLPGLGNFLAEFLTLFGSFDAHPVPVIVATVGIVFATAYSLRIMQRVFHGKERPEKKVADLSERETVVMAVLVALIVWLGLFPRPVLETSAPAVERMQQSSQGQTVEDREALAVRGGDR